MIRTTCSSRQADPDGSGAHGGSAVGNASQRRSVLAQALDLVQHYLLARIWLDVLPFGAKPISQISELNPVALICGKAAIKQD